MRNFFNLGFAICLLMLLGGCATDYQKSGLTGGYTDLQLNGDIWRVRYGGNGFTSYETVQTYWLNHCAEMALEKGYDGFEILSDVHLTLDLPVEILDSSDPLRKVHSTYVPIYIPSGGGAPPPHIIADIRLLHGDVRDTPPRQYGAASLKKRLEPIVNGKKCDNGNVCPHVHDYVYGAADARS
jgi:hypothetical protein